MARQYIKAIQEVFHEFLPTRSPNFRNLIYFLDEILQGIHTTDIFRSTPEERGL